MIIGLTGGKGSGKSTAGRCIRHKYGYKILSFAKPIKDMLMAMGISEECISDPDLKEKELEGYNKSPRWFMQSLGSEWGRALISDRIWITCLEKQMLPWNHYVIDDVRFPNEAEFIKEQGGKILHVERTKMQGEDVHVSEAGLSKDLIDGTIKNMSPNLNDLEASVVAAMEDVLDGK